MEALAETASLVGEVSVASALSRFKAEGKAKTTASTAATEAQVDSTRRASKRVKWLARAPQYVNDKWQAICSMKSRGKGKFAGKQVFFGQALQRSSVQRCLLAARGLGKSHRI